MNRECTNKKVEPVYLKTAITEPILLACMNGSSFSEIDLKIQTIIPTSELILREYIFHLVNNSFISYNGIRKIYLIEASGLDLLYIIYLQAKKGIVRHTDLTIKIE